MKRKSAKRLVTIASTFAICVSLIYAIFSHSSENTCDKSRLAKILDRNGFRALDTTLSTLCDRELSGPPEVKTFTITMLGHDLRRAQSNYERIVDAYVDKKNSLLLDAFLFTWNNQNVEPPSFIRNKKMYGRPWFTVFWAKANSLNNRWRMAFFIRTESTLVVDDDVLVGQSLMRCMFETWISFPKQIVGVDSDRRVVRHTDGDYQNPANVNETQMLEYTSNVVLTKTMILATRYLVDFMADTSVLRMIDEQRTCEDIAMNAMVNHANANTGPFYVSSACRNCERQVLNDAGGLSTTAFDETKNWTSWMQKRSRCVVWSKKHFGSGAFPPSRSNARQLNSKDPNLIKC